MRRLLLFAALTLCLGGGGWLGIAQFEREAVYPFDPRHITPAEPGLTGFSEVLFTSGIQTLVVWVAPPAAGQPTIFYLHGNAGGLANRAVRFRQFAARGYGVIAPAYRGSSGSTGKPSERTITRDMRRLWRRLNRLAPGLTPAQTVIYGESLGTGVALKLLAQDGIAPPRGVVLEAPYTSLPAVVRHVYPQLEMLIPRMRNIWNSASHATSLTAPLLVLHGDSDTLIPIAQGKQVFEATRSERKQFYTVKGADHAETWRDDSRPVLWHFIDNL